jgi:hypothetical protein
MRKAIFLSFICLALASFAMGQNYSSPVDVLGAHNNGGRGCAGCHAPHSGAYGSGHAPKGNAADSGNYALWGQDASPLYGQSLAFGDNGRYVEVLPANLTAGTADVGGILLCLSCHDGNLTYNNMMANSVYEMRIGLITNAAYGGNPIPTLLGKDGTTAGNYYNDHPVGTAATLFSHGAPIMGANVGVTWNPGANPPTFTVQAGSQYDTFIKNYGWPSIAPGVWGPQFGVNAGTPYVLCTTCHNQHVMTVYTSRPVAGGGSYPTTIGAGPGWYPTFFFVNGPYNPNINNVANANAPSTTQFCRQCHFGESNEANNTNNITTVYQ